MKNGFTLVEILVVLLVLSILGVLILVIFTQTLRGSAKSQIIAYIKQNGQAVLEKIDKNVRSAEKVICPANTAPDARTLVVKNGGTYARYRFYPPSPVSNPTANGFIQTDNPVKQIDPDTGKEETDPMFINRVCLFSDPMIQNSILTDNNPQTGISVENGSFVRDSLAGFKDQVTIRFDLRPGVRARGTVALSIDPVNFSTTISLR